uniref:Uncharacterized protein n=1 Tax=Peronospora matthiolae TaxID=2874970 RepID=A0AAV1VC64_9STRA
MIESKPSSNTLEDFLGEDMEDYVSDTAASSICDHPPDTPPARETTRIAPNPFVKRNEVPSPIAQKTAVDPASGMLHNTLDEDEAQHLQSVDDRRRQPQIVATADAHSGYLFTPLTVGERIRQTAGQSLATWITGFKAFTATALVERDVLRARYLGV